VGIGDFVRVLQVNPLVEPCVQVAERAVKGPDFAFF